MKRSKYRFLLALGVAVASFLVYRQTLLPSVSLWGDSAKFQYLAQVWGIPHPTGYPLYLLLTRIFGLLPWGDLAYRVNLLSALCAGLAVGVLTLAGLALMDRRPGRSWVKAAAAAVSALMLAFSPVFWSQAVIAEVYALNALFVALSFTLLLGWLHDRHPGAAGGNARLYAFVLVYGFSFSHHLSMILFLPAFLFLIAWYDFKALIRPRSWLVALLGVGLGLLPYAYILLRASQGAAYSEFPSLSDRGLLAAFVDYVSGAQFRSGFFALFDQDPAAWLDRLIFYADMLLQQFRWWGLGLGLLGLIGLLRRQWPLVLGLVLAFLGQVVFSLSYAIIDPEVYFIPSYMIWTMFMAVGLAWVGRGLAWLLRAGSLPAPVGTGTDAKRARARRKIAGALFLVLCLVLVLLPLTGNYAAADQSRNDSARHWAQGFLHDVENDALLVLPLPFFYSQQQVLRYMQLAEGRAPDAQFIHKSEIDDRFGQQPIYLVVRQTDVEERYRLQAVDSSSTTLNDSLAALPEGSIVLAAARDEASIGLSDSAVTALQGLGGKASLKGCFRCGHALIGVKGAAAGTAPESAGEGLHQLQVAAGQEIGSSGVKAPVDISVRSAGFEDGDLAEILVGGQQVSPGERGYNLVVVDAQTGRVLSVVHADTFHTDLVDNVRKWRVESRR